MQCGETTTGVARVLYAVWYDHYRSYRSLVCNVVRPLLGWLESCMQCREATTGVPGVLYAVW